jgi:hypothetical protein
MNRRAAPFRATCRPALPPPASRFGRGGLAWAGLPDLLDLDQTLRSRAGLRQPEALLARP